MFLGFDNAGRTRLSLKGLTLHMPNPFRVWVFFMLDPRVVASSNPGLELANAFGVIVLTFKLHHYLNTIRCE